MKQFLILVLIFISACGPQALIALPSLSAQQPQVASVSPAYNEVADADAVITVTFSKAVDGKSINRDSFLVIENFSDKPAPLLEEDIADGKLMGMEGEYLVAGDNLTATFQSGSGFIAGKTYGVILTTKIVSLDRFALNQTPGSTQSPFISKFIIKDNIIINQEDNTNTSQYTLSSEGAVQVGAGDTVQSESVAKPLNLIINEVYYDAPDSDTNGDLFVELRGTSGGVIDGYKVVFVNGDDGKVTESVTLPSDAKNSESGLYVIAGAKTGNPDATNVAIADFIANFDPQNGPDAVQLLDDKGVLTDAVCYGDVKTAEAENGLAMCEGSFAPDVPSGQSLSRLPDADDTNDNAADFMANETPSPGE